MYKFLSKRNRILPAFFILFTVFTYQKVQSQKMIPPVESYSKIVSSNSVYFFEN
jgi:hypothetical protein